MNNMNNTNKLKSKEYYFEKAKQYKLNNQWENAIENFKKTIEIDKFHIQSFKELSEIYETIQDIPNAILCYKNILQYNTNTNINLFILNQLGICYHKQNNHIEALTYFRKILKFRNGKLPDVYNNIAKMYFALRQYKLVEVNLLISLKLKETDEVYKELGLLYLCLKQYDKSIEYYHKISDIHTNVTILHNLSFSYLASKQFKKGFELHENRLLYNHIHPQTGVKERVEIPTIPFWNGSNLDCKHLLIIYEQGIGDNIQYYRYVVQLSKKYPEMKITYFCKDNVAHLFKEYENVYITTYWTNNDFYNYKCYIMSLPYYLQIDTIVANTENYIQVDEEKVAYWKQKMEKMEDEKDEEKDEKEFKNPKKLRVGFFCKGLLQSQIEKQIAFQEFNILTDLHICLICLHKENELNPEDKLEKIFYFDIDKDKTFVDTIAILHNLDVLLTVDTSLVHLAGVLGIKTILMLGNISEWRWFHNDESVWYDSVKIMRSVTNDLKDILPKVKICIEDMIV